MSFLTILIDWVHLVSTATWIGGIIFFNFVVYRALEEVDPKNRGKVMASVSKNFSKLVNPAVVLLVITGLFNSYDGSLVFGIGGSSYQMVLGIKMLIVGLMIGIGYYIPLRLAPKSASLAPKPGEKPDPEFIKTQTLMRQLALVNMGLGILLLFLASILLNGGSF